MLSVGHCRTRSADRRLPPQDVRRIERHEYEISKPWDMCIFGPIGLQWHWEVMEGPSVGLSDRGRCPRNAVAAWSPVSIVPRFLIPQFLCSGSSARGHTISVVNAKSPRQKDFLKISGSLQGYESCWMYGHSTGREPNRDEIVGCN
jgi:hypothetical protein